MDHEAGEKTSRGPGTAEFEVAYARLWPGLARLGHLLAGSRALGEEIAQEAFVSFLARSNVVDNPSAYLRRSVVNLSLTIRKRAAREQALLLVAREEPSLPPDVDDTWAAVVHLPPRQRAALVLRFYEDLSEAQTAAVLGCRPGTVKSLTSRGLARLRKELAP